MIRFSVLAQVGAIAQVSSLQDAIMRTLECSLGDGVTQERS
ncbi:MAG: hypothetical protein V7K35_01250 [Nostoc sp.]